MRNIFIVTLIGFFMGAAAAVASPNGTLAYSYISPGTGLNGTVLPGPAAVGVPLQANINGETTQIKSITVTISDFRDSGVDDFQQVGNGRLIALLAKANARDPDGGQQWARYPAFDIEVDGGNPFIPGGGGAITYSVQLNSASLGLGAGKLLYFSQGVIAADGGALPHKVHIEGSY